MPKTGINAHNKDTVMSSWAEIPPPPDYIYDLGACVGKPQAWFFKDTPQDRQEANALACCAGCPVREPCLQYALSLPWGVDFGVWGGTNRNQRKKMRNGNA